jgi:VWFA-related protein
MSVKRRFELILLGFLCSAAVLAAQQTTPSRPASASTIDLAVVVTPRTGAPVADLEQTDFTILDNKTPRPITSFHALSRTSAPIHVTLLIDAVNVPFESIAYQRGQIDKFLSANEGQLAYPTQLAFFTDTGVEIQQGFSTEGNELRSSLDHHDIGLRDIHRASQFERSDRFDLSMTALRSLIARGAKVPGRKMILWISPGWPLLSGPGIELDWKQQKRIFSLIVDLSTQLRQTDTTLYNINPIGAAEGPGRSFYYEVFLKGVSKPGQVNIGDLSLQVLAIQSGGLALYGNNDTTALLQRCIADTHAYYQLSFTPAVGAHRDEYHHLEILVNRPGLTAHTRQGYYAQP